MEELKPLDNAPPVPGQPSPPQPCAITYIRLGQIAAGFAPEPEEAKQMAKALMDAIDARQEYT